MPIGARNYYEGFLKMETTPLFKIPETTTFQPEDKIEDVRRLDEGVNDIEGPVVVGGRYSADCFWSERQAGQPDEPIELIKPYDPTAEHEPRTRPW